MVQAALGSGTAHRRVGLRAVPAPAAGGTPLRRGGRRRPGARRARALQVRRRGARRARERVVDDATREWLAVATASRGDIWGYAEGEVYFPYSPLLVVEGTFAEAVLLETLLLSIYNHDSAIASAASRMTMAAGDRPCIEMGSRRTHEEAAVACARAAYIAGFATHLQPRGPPAVRRADRRHQRAQLHAAARHRGATRSAPRSTSLGAGTTLLVDTYDVARGRPARRRDRRPGLGAVRLDSGDLGVLAHQVRDQLDELGATEDPDRGDQRPRRVRHRGAGRRPRRRLRRRHPAGHRQRAPDLRLRLQAGLPRGRRRRDGVGGQAEHRQDLDRRPQVRPAAARRRGRRRGRGDRHRRAARRRRRRPLAAGRRWCATARSSAASRSTPPATGTGPPAPSCRWSAQQMSKGEPVIPTHRTCEG